MSCRAVLLARREDCALGLGPHPSQVVGVCKYFLLQENMIVNLTEMKKVEFSHMLNREQAFMAPQGIHHACSSRGLRRTSPG